MQRDIEVCVVLCGHDDIVVADFIARLILTSEGDDDIFSEEVARHVRVVARRKVVSVRYDRVVCGDGRLCLVHHDGEVAAYRGVVRARDSIKYRVCVRVFESGKCARKLAVFARRVSDGAVGSFNRDCGGRLFRAVEGESLIFGSRKSDACRGD